MEGAIPRVPAKHILSPYQKNGWFGSGYTMNLYRGCCHGCIYCDSRSACYGVEDFDTVHAKENALALLEADLRAARRHGVVLTGSMGDPYNPFEPAERLTHGALNLFCRYGFGAVVLTKSDLVLNDLGLLLRLGEREPVAVMFSITALDDELCRQVEPHAPPTSARLAALRELCAAGVLCGVVLTPILPFLEDTPGNVTGIVHAAARAGAAYCYVGGPGDFGVTQRTGQREYFHAELARRFHGMETRYKRAFGPKYFCASPRALELQAAFEAACREEGLEWRLPRIEGLIKGAEPSQMTFL